MHCGNHPAIQHHIFAGEICFLAHAVTCVITSSGHIKRPHHLGVTQRPQLEGEKVGEIKGDMYGSVKSDARLLVCR